MWNRGRNPGWPVKELHVAKRVVEFYRQLICQRVKSDGIPGALGLLGHGFIDPPLVGFPPEFLRKFPQLRAAIEQQKLAAAREGTHIYQGLFNGPSRIKVSACCCWWWW